MTAEVAVLNRSAIALAADSAVTIPSPSGDKTYNTVNKLFTLSKYFPIAVMVYGNANFMGYPWETLIKVYRQKLGKTEFSSVKEYLGDFLRFLSADLSFSQAELNARAETIWNAWFVDLDNQLRNRLRAAVSETGSTLDKEAAEREIEQAIQERVDSLRKMDDIEALSGLNMDDLLQAHKDYLQNVSDRHFPGRPLSAQSKRLLTEFVKLAIIKDVMSPVSSGVVVAGFGGNEFFPKLYSFATDGYIGDLHRFTYFKNAIIDHDSGAQIMAFADHQMVTRFMEGDDPLNRSYMESGIVNLLSDIVRRIIKENVPPDNQGEALERSERVAHDIFDDFITLASRYRYDTFTAPIIDAIAVLPKEELANLAESLVNLTSLKRRMSLDAETVGGPIDVAVITKGDGFIWIKRKHYFKPELNPCFERLYLS